MSLPAPIATSMECEMARLPNRAQTSGADRMSPILVVDDDPKIVALVRAYLERDGFRVVEALDGNSALAAIEAHHPRLLVLDLMLPDIDGIAVTRHLKQEWDVPILMMSARGTVADRVYGINEGVDDYLPKPFSPAELVARVRAILRRAEAALPDRAGQLRFEDIVIDLDRHQVHRGEELIALTSAELRILAVLVRAQGRVLSREVLMDALYGPSEVGVLDRTVDVYVRRLRAKLGDDADVPCYVATVRGAGYRAVIAPESRR